MLSIRQASTTQDFELTATLFRELLLQEYHVPPERVAAAHANDNPRGRLPGLYASPQGAVLLAFESEEPAGCVGLRPLEEGVCELKRLYVRPAFRGRSYGRRLTEEAIAVAGRIGYRHLRLLTVESLEAAVRLYRSMGFKNCAAFTNEVPPEMKVIFMELPLQSESPSEKG